MKKFKDTDMQLLLGRVLRAGTVTSVCIVFFGGVIYLHGYGHFLASYKVFNGTPSFLHQTGSLFEGVLALRGQAIIQIGILLLIATPILRVIFSAIGFVLEKDYLYVGISLLVLLIIFTSMLGGHAG
ncbi:MAG: DUF1634 domain-containing protein [Mucilaginibacter sp.]